MPAKNLEKQYAPDSYYHIYSRGVAKQTIFLDEQDYATFLSLLKRYLSKKPETSRGHGLYPTYYNQVHLLCYCLMPNHIHLLLFQTNETAMTRFMRSLMTSYGMYFNRKYKRVGPVFQSRYKASRISSDEYLDHITRYIHLNPTRWEDYPYSSLKYYEKKASASWIKPTKILELFPSVQQYREFLRDYEGHKAMLDELQWELADN